MPLRYEQDNHGATVVSNSHGLTFYLTGLHGQPPPKNPPTPPRVCRPLVTSV
ncbi:MAG: hypothetical protein JWM80_6592 [Cyanobacteria bacterium RYN_339]|nr:hypothetical protein [Cyanobacteria bacterium RYN_339]